MADDEEDLYGDLPLDTGDETTSRVKEACGTSRALFHICGLPDSDRSREQQQAKKLNLY